MSKHIVFWCDAPGCENDRLTSEEVINYKGHHFCSEECKEVWADFENEPEVRHREKLNDYA